MRVLSHITGTIILFVIFMVIAETLAWCTPLNAAYMMSVVTLALVVSHVVADFVWDK